MSLFGDTDFLLVYKQWGLAKCANNNYVLFSLPIAFKNLGIITATDVFNVDNTSGNINQSLIGIGLIGLYQARARGRGINDVGETRPNSNPTFNWFAIGC